MRANESHDDLACLGSLGSATLNKIILLVVVLIKKIKPLSVSVEFLANETYHGSQHNDMQYCDTKHNDTRHSKLNCTTQHKRHYADCPIFLLLC
jgi:hypothetical protein